VTREDKDKYCLLHFIDKGTGIPLFQEWRRKDRLFGDSDNDNENTGGREPYAMLFFRKIKKVFKKEYVGSMDCQLSSLVILSEFIQMNTGRLVKKRSKKPLTQSDIAKELGVSVRRAAEILSNLKANGILERKDGAYAVKREYLAKGRTKTE
jgi:DNA-binding MarR family transcriptional regulator